MVTPNDRLCGNALQRRVFFAAHPDTPYLTAVSKALAHACFLMDLELVCGCSSKTDTLDEIGGASIVVADVTHDNPYVTYDIGIAHALGLPVLCLSHRQQGGNLADLQGIRMIYYGDMAGEAEKKNLSDVLYERLRQVLGRVSPDVTDSFRERTAWIVRDLKKLETSQDRFHQTVWYSGFLSALSMSYDGLEPGERQFWVDLEAEREAVIRLSRECRIVCIISPPSQETLRPEKADLVWIRIKCLLDFITTNDKASIDWVLSPYKQKNFYLIGDVSCIERFQKEVAQGVDLTLRQSGEAAIRGNRAVYQAQFDKLTHLMFPDGLPVAESLRESLRQATVHRLQESLEYCDLTKLKQTKP
jgi:hypothetical protein